VQNFIKLSAALHELSFAHRKKNSDENNAVRRCRGQWQPQTTLQFAEINISVVYRVLMDVAAEYIFKGQSGTIPCIPRSALKVEVPNRAVTWLDVASTPLTSGRLLPKPNGDLHVVDSAIEDTQVLKCLITGAGSNKSSAPEMIVYEHVLFGELFFFRRPVTVSNVKCSVHSVCGQSRGYFIASVWDVFRDLAFCLLY